MTDPVTRLGLKREKIGVVIIERCCLCGKLDNSLISAPKKNKRQSYGSRLINEIILTKQRFMVVLEKLSNHWERLHVCNNNDFSVESQISTE